MVRYDFDNKIKEMIAQRVPGGTVVTLDSSIAQKAYDVYRACTVLVGENHEDKRDYKLTTRGVTVVLMSAGDSAVRIGISIRFQVLACPLSEKNAYRNNMLGILLASEMVEAVANPTRGGGDLTFWLGGICTGINCAPFVAMSGDYDNTPLASKDRATQFTRELQTIHALDGDTVIYDNGESDFPMSDGVTYIFDAIAKKGFTLSNISNVAPCYASHTNDGRYNITEIAFCGPRVVMSAPGIIAMLYAGCVSVAFRADMEANDEVEIVLAAFDKYDSGEGG